MIIARVSFILAYDPDKRPGNAYVYGQVLAALQHLRVRVHFPALSHTPAPVPRCLVQTLRSLRGMDEDIAMDEPNKAGNYRPSRKRQASPLPDPTVHKYVALFAQGVAEVRW